MQSLRTARIHDAPSQKVFVVERIERHARRDRRGVFLSASITPLAIVIWAPGRLSAVGADAEPIGLDSLSRDDPDLYAEVRRIGMTLSGEGNDAN